MGSKAMKQEFLPAEVLQNILSFIPWDRHRYKTLRDSCLVCSYWRRAAQPLLFSRITDEYNEYDGYDETDDLYYQVFPKFTTIISLYPYLAKHVQAIEITLECWHDSDSRADQARQTSVALKLLDEIRAQGVASVHGVQDEGKYGVPAQHIPLVYPHISIGYIIFMTGQCSNLRSLSVRYQNELTVAEAIDSRTIWPNLRELTVTSPGHSTCPSAKRPEAANFYESRHSLENLAGLLATPTLQSVCLEAMVNKNNNFSLLSTNTSLNKLELCSAWLHLRHLESVIESFPSLETFAYSINIYGCHEYYWPKRWRNFTPGEAILALSRSKTLRHLSLKMFEYPRRHQSEDEPIWTRSVADKNPPSFFVQTCRSLGELRTLSIDVPSIFGPILSGFTTSHALRGFKDSNELFRDFFPSNIRELTFTNIAGEVIQAFRWLADNVREEVPNLKRIIFEFHTRNESDASPRPGDLWLLSDSLKMGPQSLQNACAQFESKEILSMLPESWDYVVKALLAADVEVVLRTDTDSSWVRLGPE